MEKLIVSEIFKTLAGEGMDAGIPSIYVRVFGCNMNPPCPFCDTMFSVKKIDDTLQILTLREIEEKIESMDCLRVAFTGGEPFMQIERIQQIMLNLSSKRRYSYHFETNGMIYNDIPIVDQLGCEVTVAISPKLHAIDGVYVDSLASWITKASDRAFLKFVYENKESIEKIKQLERDVDGFGTLPVYIMPEGRGFNKPLYQECYKVCSDNNWRLSPRLQCMIWDDERGT